MSLNWNNVSKLSEPVKTVKDDVIFSGHGSLESISTTQIPEGVELWVLAPPGASIADKTGQALEDMTTISYLGILNPGDDNLIGTQPVVYTSGMTAPDYVLHAPRGIKVKPKGPHVLGVEKDSATLSSLWTRVKPFLKDGKTVKCYWAACTIMKNAKNPVVLYK